MSGNRPPIVSECPEEGGIRMASTDAGLIGRDGELSRLRGLLDRSQGGTQVLVLLGDPGMGKTVLLADAARRARSKGIGVLSVAGRESEQDLAFAGMHQLLRPVLDRVAGLPDRQAKALLGAFALSADPVPPDALVTGIAVLTLLSGLSEDGPLLVVADDAQWLDRGSLGTLAFAARRLDTEPLVLLVGARGNLPPQGFARDFLELLLRPLRAPDAGRLLDAQPRPPRGRAREQVLAQAAGNPMALIELSRVIAVNPAAGRRWAAEPLPLSDRLTAIMAAQFSALPGSAQHALLLAAVADSSDLQGAGVPGLTADALAPAETAGLIRVDGSGPRFTHPLVRAAVYHAVPFAERAAARALERAAELSPDEGDQARRLLAAAALALAAGQADWVQELATLVLLVTSDPDLRTAARLQIGWALVWSNQHADALATLIAVAEEAAPRLPVVAWNAVGLAGTVAYQTGLPDDRQAVLSALDRLEEPPPPAPVDWPAGHADEQRVWIAACTEPFANRAKTVPYLHQIASGPVTDVAQIGAAAWLLDETELAVRLLREALSRLRAPGVRGGSGAALSALQWACIDSGRWDEALAAAREASDTAAAYRMETVAASADLATATVLAMRGDHDQARPLLASALASVDAAEYRGFTARARHAGGIAALAAGSYLAAWAQLSQLFGTDGAPLHHHVSYLGIADLAAAGVRAERPLEARTLVERALAQADQAPGPRLEQLTARACGLLADPGGAEAHLGN